MIPERCPKVNATICLMLALGLAGCGGNSTGPHRSDLAGVGMTSSGDVHTLRAQTNPPDSRPVFVWEVVQCPAGGSCFGHTVGETQGPDMSEPVEEARCIELRWTVALDYDRSSPGFDDREEGAHFTC